MTVEEGIMKIQVLFNIEEDLMRLLVDFKDVCQDVPLSDVQEDSFIKEYNNSLANLKRIHGNIIDSCLDWIIDIRAT